jgi:hypothetical protein
VARKEKEFDEEAAGEFGTWVKHTLDRYTRQTGRVVTLEMLAEDGGFEYSHLHGIIKGRRGEPVKPRPDTVARLIETLHALGVPADAAAGMDKANLTPAGYVLVPVGDAPEHAIADDEAIEKYMKLPPLLKEAAGKQIAVLSDLSENNPAYPCIKPQPNKITSGEREQMDRDNDAAMRKISEGRKMHSDEGNGSSVTEDARNLIM